MLFRSPISQPTFVEAGVGSGCISVSILHSLTASKAVATDVSNEALRLSARNAQRLNVADRLELRNADLFSGVSGSYDAVVSNPPYIPEGDRETLQDEVRLFEPATALFAGEDGLAVVRRIVRDAGHVLRAGGVLLMEIGFGQSNQVGQMLSLTGWDDVTFIRDLQGIDRVARAVLRGDN